MKTLLFESANGGLKIEVLVDMMRDSQDLIVPLDIRGAGVDEIAIGANWQKKPVNLADMKAWAVLHSLKMTILDDTDGTSTAVNSATDFAITTDSVGGGTNGVAQVDVVTVPATSGATQGDSVIITNHLGETLAIWLDIDKDGTAPTAEAVTGADTIVMASIVTGGTTAQNAAIVVAAIETVEDFGVTLTDNADGSFDIAHDYQAEIAVPVLKSADGSGAGSITKSQTAEGVDPTEYQDVVEVEGAVGDIEFSVSDGELPEGLELDSRTGVISGYPTATADDYAFDIDAEDKWGASDTVSLTITISAPAG